MNSKTHFRQPQKNSNAQFATPPERLVIASRKSRLAMRQAEQVRIALRELYPSCDVRILGMTTRGDQIIDRPLPKVGGKGLFVKELEAALTDGRADLAVHSLKDVPMELPDGFVLGAIMERSNPHDAFVSARYGTLAEMPEGSVVGTSSLRRESMLRMHFPNLDVRPLRGNLDTRLAKLDNGDYSGIILAAAGLQRLGLESRIRLILSADESLPAPGQGALGIEILGGRRELVAWLAPLHHEATATAVEAERMVSRSLGGNCEVPLAAHANWHDGTLRLRGLVATTDGARVMRAEASTMDPCMQAAIDLGRRVSADLEAQGAMDIVRALSSASLLPPATSAD
ncbi:hydroxymethylbilane synthase [Paraburkholderia sp. BL8N3]|nr:hydroxymethylbilane synthase [Paraburkholderia sp. BL8N3]TCK33817.1 hydroxymethylbilane synthase [Paraburkholderia sp. BL8N3]